MSDKASAADLSPIIYNWTGSIGNSGRFMLFHFRDIVPVLIPDMIQINGTATVSGGGEIAMAGSKIVSNGASATFINIDNTIDGNGQIGDANLTLVNDGTISCGQLEGGTTLVIDTGSNVISNAGTMQAAGGILDCRSDVDNSGMIAAAFTTVASEVDLRGNITNTGARLALQAAQRLKTGTEVANLSGHDWLTGEKS